MPLTWQHVLYLVGVLEVAGLMELDFCLDKNILGDLSPQQPHIALLNEPVENLPRSKQRLIVFMLLAANLTIPCS